MELETREEDPHRKKVRNHHYKVASCYFKRKKEEEEKKNAFNSEKELCAFRGIEGGPWVACSVNVHSVCIYIPVGCVCVCVLYPPPIFLLCLFFMVVVRT